VIEISARRGRAIVEKIENLRESETGAVHSIGVGFVTGEQREDRASRHIYRLHSLSPFGTASLTKRRQASHTASDLTRTSWLTNMYERQWVDVK
jgi:hypothetical protein